LVVIEAEGLVKRFGRVEALKGVSFRAGGRVVAIVGPNGCGKTTLLSIMVGVRRPSEGRLLLNGVEPYVRREEVLKTVSFAFEKPRFNIGSRVEDVFSVASELCSDYGELKALASELGLDPLRGRRLYELSSGEAQLVALTLALGCDKSATAVLDEPLAHLDVGRQSALARYISVRGEVVFTTHVFEEAEALADDVVILNSGRVKWVGSVDDMFRDGLYEVLVRRSRLGELAEGVGGCGGEILADFGTYVVVRGVDEGVLEPLLRRGVLIGFRRAGLRVRVYGG